jgi:hypothetical protein
MEVSANGERIIAHLGSARAVAARSLDPRCRRADREDLMAWGVVGLARAKGEFQRLSLRTRCKTRRLRALPGEGRTLPVSAAHVQKVLLCPNQGRCLQRVVRFGCAAIPVAHPVNESGDDRPKEQGEQGERPKLLHRPQPTAPACAFGSEGAA